MQYAWQNNGVRLKMTRLLNYCRCVKLVKCKLGRINLHQIEAKWGSVDAVQMDAKRQ